MQNPPQKHHYIPEFYSRRWARSDETLVRFYRPHQEVIERRVFPSQVGFQRNLYRIPDVSPSTAQQIELSFFKRIDDAAARALEALIAPNSPRLEVKTRIDWTRFILSLMHRTPASFEAL